jgi:hypothetical protein
MLRTRIDRRFTTKTITEENKTPSYALIIIDAARGVNIMKVDYIFSLNDSRWSPAFVCGQRKLVTNNAEISASLIEQLLQAVRQLFQTRRYQEHIYNRRLYGGHQINSCNICSNKVDYVTDVCLSGQSACGRAESWIDFYPNTVLSTHSSTPSFSAHTQRTNPHSQVS